jgi:hypothetical protein
MNLPQRLLESNIYHAAAAATTTEMAHRCRPCFLADLLPVA